MEELSFGPERKGIISKSYNYGMTSGPSMMVGLQEGKKSRSKMEPKKRAAINLFKSLGLFSNIFLSEEQRRKQQNIFENMPQIRHMNTKVLAMVLAFLERNPVLNQESFDDKNVEPYISKIYVLTNLKKKEKKQIINRYKQTMLRYIRAIKKYRSDRQLF